MELRPTWATYLAIILATLLLIKSLSRRRRNLNLPPGPKPWPVIGNLDLMGALPHRSLDALAKKYGPVISLRFGSFPVVVGSSVDMAKFFLKTHDHVFADRPKTIAGKYSAYNYSGIVLTPYGPYWRMARKMCLTELFSTRRLVSYEYIRKEEIHALLCNLFTSSGRSILLKKYLSATTLNIILRMTVGEKSLENSDGEEFRRTLDEAFMVTGAVSNIGDWIPWLGFFDLQGYVRSIKNLSKLYDRFLEHILEEHNERRRHEGARFVARDMVDVLLQLAEDPNLEVEFKREGVKAFIQDIIAGGTESSAVTMEWTVSELLKQPEIFGKATEELDRVIGRNRWVEEKDIPHLPYVEAIVKETMRMHPVGPVLVPHLSRERATVAGYDIPAGTRVLVNVWTIGRDPTIWEAPEEFRPERFFESSVDVKGQHFELLPFGAGRRMCPAYNLALKVVQVSIANLLHGFAWRLPAGMKEEDVNMEEIFGLSTRRKVPLEAVVEPKLPAHLYIA